jgi:hypothetical protein
MPTVKANRNMATTTIMFLVIMKAPYAQPYQLIQSLPVMTVTDLANIEGRLQPSSSRALASGADHMDADS